MKRTIAVLLLLLLLSLTACSGQETRAESAVSLPEGVWPENEYTEGIPVPPGTVKWASLDAEHGYCVVSLTDVDEDGFRDYMALLAQEGYATVEEVSEPVQGQDYVSVGTLLTNGEKGLSISYVPDGLTISISFDRR